MIYRHSFNGILIGTYTRPTQRCRFKCPWVILSDLAKYSMTRSDLSATAELLVNTWCIVRDQEYWPSETSPERLLVLLVNQLWPVVQTIVIGRYHSEWTHDWASFALIMRCLLVANFISVFFSFFYFCYHSWWIQMFILCHDFAFKMSPVMF